MKRFYHLDRRGMLSEGQIIKNLPVKINTNFHELKHHAENLFPDGVSAHGQMYLNTAGDSNTQIEWYFEMIRRTIFNRRPSRFQSVFAFSTLDELNRFKAEQGLTDDIPIFELECSSFFRADMNLLKTNSSYLSMSWFAHQYWSGETNEELNKKFNLVPLWENLLNEPVFVKKRT